MPLFRGKRDIALVKRYNRELIEDIVGDLITYYPISKRFSEADFYGESKEKIVEQPVEAHALIRWEDQKNTTTEFGVDKEYSLTVYLLNEYLKEVRLQPTMGDMVNYDDVFFEITSVSEPNLIYGKASERLGTKLQCVSVRDSSFSIVVSGAVEFAPNTSPDDPLGLDRFDGLIEVSGLSSGTGGGGGAGGGAIVIADPATAIYDMPSDVTHILTSYSLTGAQTINLPSIADHISKNIIIKDKGFNASQNNITIVPDGSETIDGEDVQVISQDGSAINIVALDGEWSVV